MSHLRTILSGTTHDLDEEGMTFLPLFVRARLEYLDEVLEWSDETFTYYEIPGKCSNGYYTWHSGKRVSPIHLWIGSDDNCNRSLYLGGSSCWICPDNEALFFDSIDPILLPEQPDPTVWWCIQCEEGINVIKILVRPPEEITEGFPDGV